MHHYYLMASMNDNCQDWTLTEVADSVDAYSFLVEFPAEAGSKWTQSEPLKLPSSVIV